MASISSSAQTTSNAPKSRLSALDGLRGVFALMIVFLHMPYDHIFLNSPVIRNAGIVVDFFFVLSGFVLSFGYSDKLASGKDGWHFMLLRIGRLWPLHVFILILYLLVSAARILASELGIFHADSVPLDADFWVHFVQDLFLLQIVRNEIYYPLNFPAWSISAEMLAYSLFVIGFVILRASVIFFAVLAILGLLGLAGVVDPGFGRIGLFRVLAAFFLGCFVFRVWNSSRRVSLERASLWEFACLGLFILLIWNFSSLPGARIAAVAIFCLSVYVFAFEGGAVSRLLNTRPFQVLGVRSYSIYMIHVFILICTSIMLRMIERLLDTSLYTDGAINGDPTRLVSFGPGLTELATIFMAGVVVVISGWTYRYIELPGQSAAREFVKQRRERG